MQWEEVRKMGEVEMESFIAEWCSDVQVLQHVDIERTWTRYRVRGTGGKSGKEASTSKCQGRWHEVHDEQVQNMKKGARQILALLKRRRRAGVDVSDLYTR